MAMVPPETENLVKGVRLGFNQSVRNILRREMGLQLTRNEEGGQRSSRPTSNVPIKVLPGYPAEYRFIELDSEKRLPILLAPLLGDFRAFIVSGETIQMRLPSETPEDLKQTVSDHFPSSIEAARRLLNIADKYDPIPDLFGDPVDDHSPGKNYLLDFLGVYRYRFRNSASDPAEETERIDAKIELYWGAIGLCAGILGTTVEGLTLQVLAHELAHAYSHMGYDIDARRWPSARFRDSDPAIKEGLAQYYAHRTVIELQTKMPQALSAHNALVPRQPHPYKVHIRWEEGFDDGGSFTPEEVRLAMISIRRDPDTDLNNFEMHLVQARERLR